MSGTDKDDDLFEDETSAIIDKALSDQGFDDDTPDDDGGLDQPPDEATGTDDHRVSAEDGADLVSDARIKGEEKPDPKDPEQDKGAKPAEDKADEKPEADAAAPEDGKKPEDEASGDKGDGAGDKDAAADLTSMSQDDLLADLPDDRREEVTRRLKASTEAMAPFESAFAKDEMKRWGASPSDMAKRLTGIAEYASSDPAGYLAWAAKEMAASPDKIVDVLNEAAKKLGYQVSPADEDLFEDDEVLAARRAKRLAEAQGPDSPQFQQTRDAEAHFNAFINEVDQSTGQPKRPLFATLQPQITAAARELSQRRGGQPGSITFEDLDAIYNGIVNEIRGQGGAVPNPAAQPAPQPAQPEPKKAEAQADKAKRASMSVDGGGQGAPRRPAQDTDDLNSLIGGLVDQQLTG
ncbi:MULTISPECIES: hypothetical protein [unclassified Mameliella]|uniref:hypothetical protein n=1 Tax=unclassified Mameliella TaxID=2630630 RepID=UPI00273DE882|nr:MULTISPECIES: hypothetical protein [unclassified Mameliella]